MKWVKKGILFKPQGQGNAINSHAQIMAPIIVNDNTLRIFFSSRPKPDLTLPFYVDLDLESFEIKYVHSTPLMSLGRPGTFDEHGIMPSTVVNNNGRLFLYYSGWQKSIGVPYNNYTGLAVSQNGGVTFERYSEAPILDRNKFELYSATSPLVYFENNIWHAYYSSGTNWHEIGNKLEHTYDIKYASSIDGYNWSQEGVVAIKAKNEFEAICKPAIIKMDNIYHMWFSYRGSNSFRDGLDSYRIGYATSSDLINWNRDDTQSGIDVSETGWDSKMVAYPSIFEYKDKYYMLYNGNGFGKDGFGYAELVL